MAVTSNLWLVQAPGNVALPVEVTRLPKPSVVNVTQLRTVDRQVLDGLIAKLPGTHCGLSTKVSGWSWVSDRTTRAGTPRLAGNGG